MKVVVFGGTGVVGRAAAEHFAADVGADVLAVSRRPLDVDGVRHVPVDLADDAASRASLRSDAFAGTTHVVFSALQEKTDLLSGWRHPGLMAHNLRLFRNALEPLVDNHGGTLRHVSLLQGAKAYGGSTSGALQCRPRSDRRGTTTRTSTSCRRTRYGSWPTPPTGRGRSSVRRSCTGSRSGAP